MSTEIIIAVIALAVFLIARKARPAGNQQGINLQPPDLNSTVPNPTSSNTLTVATFNIQSGKSNAGVRDISKTAGVLDEPDIVGLQEVLGASWLNKAGFGNSQTQSLSTDRFAPLFAATRRRWFREHRGNAVLSKLPINRWRVEMLPDQTGKQYRNMVVCNLQWQGNDITFINTHLHTKKGREEQMQVVLEEFARHPCAILVGDLNSSRDTPLLEAALNENLITDAIDQAQLDKDNPRRIDWILTKGFKIEGGKMLPKGVSDHPYYQVSLSLDDA